MAEILSNVSIVLYVIAGVCFVLAILFWFVFDIPTVFGDLTGRTARKSIAKMRENNEKSGVKSFKHSKINVDRGKLTGVPETTENIAQETKGNKVVIEDETGLLDEATALLVESEETTLLVESEETGLLEENVETGLLAEVEETGLLVEDNETALLEEIVQYNIPASGKSLEMIESIMLIHTREVI